MTNYYDGLNKKLFNSIPLGARKILELGCANGKLGQLFKENNPNVFWVGVEIDSDAVREAAKVIDKVYELDIDNEGLENIGNDFDVIVIGDLLEHLKFPQLLLDKIWDISSSQAIIVCCLPNMTHISVIEKLISGDMSYDEMGLLDKTHLKFYSPSSAIKLFLDTGWLPDVVDEYRMDPRHDDFYINILKAANNLGISSAAAASQLGTYQVIFKCKKQTYEILTKKGPMTKFSVIVPVNRDWQFNNNIIKSPGLAEVGVDIVPVYNSKNMADAYAIGSKSAKTDWHLLAHQDVYFPIGSGFSIARHLGLLMDNFDINSPVGFAGLEFDNSGNYNKSGLIIDRLKLFDYKQTNQASSIDEFSVVIHRNSNLKIDPNLGWHLWATDLCLQSFDNNNFSGKVINVPVYHNSINDFSISKEFKDSCNVLMNKYKNFESINTLCCNITRMA